MSIIKSADELAGSEWPYEVPDMCFHCGQLLTFPILHWSGHSGAIYMHPKCAISLGTKLIIDGGRVSKTP